VTIIFQNRKQFADESMNFWRKTFKNKINYPKWNPIWQNFHCSSIWKFQINCLLILINLAFIFQFLPSIWAWQTWGDPFERAEMALWKCENN